MYATIGECLIVIFLFIAMLDLLYSAELGRNNDTDAKNIRNFVILFSSTFCVRAITNVLGIYTSFPFAPGFENIGTNILWSVQFLIYNILPIMYLVKTHHSAWKPKEYIS